MNDRSTTLLAIRPTISTATTLSEEEQFQNITLRPILKFQNELILSLFENYIEKRKNVFHQLSLSKKENYIKDSLQKDTQLRQLLLGVVIGHFTLEEWKTYQNKESQLKKRIISLLIQRLQSQIDLFSI